MKTGDVLRDIELGQGGHMRLSRVERDKNDVVNIETVSNHVMNCHEAEHQEAL
jgi:hypothetical protein